MADKSARLRSLAPRSLKRSTGPAGAPASAEAVKLLTESLLEYKPGQKVSTSLLGAAVSHFDIPSVDRVAIMIPAQCVQLSAAPPPWHCEERLAFDVGASRSCADGDHTDDREPFTAFG